MIFLSVSMERYVELTEPILGGFDLVREVRDGFPKQTTFNMRSELVLEKTHKNEKSEEVIPGVGNSMCKAPVGKGAGQELGTERRRSVWPGGEWVGECPGPGLKREAGANCCRASQAHHRYILFYEPWIAKEGCW